MTPSSQTLESPSNPGRFTFRKKKDAEAELGKRVSLIAENRYLDVKKEYTTTLKELLDKYEENYKDQKAFITAKRFFVTNFREYFGEQTLLANIRYVNIETYRNHLKLKPTQYNAMRSDASVNREMSCLRHMLSKAVEWEMIEQSPFDKGKSLMIKENNKRFRFLTEDEISRLLDECPQYLRDIVECAINTGMRKSEILNLKWDQVRNGFIYLEKTKTNEARQIPINDTLEVLFKNIRKKHGFKSKYVFLYTGQVYKTKTGKIRRPIKKVEAKPVAEVKSSFKSVLTRAGIVDFRFHDLRHTFASQLLLKGGTLKDVQELLGHKSMTMTLRYAHLTQEHKRKAVNLLNGLTASAKCENLTCHKTGKFPDQEKRASV